jgi:hypothetical protein
VSGSFVAGSTVTFTITADPNCTVLGWSGDFSSSSSTLSFIMPAAATSVVASSAFCFVLSISVGSGSHSGNISISPSNSAGCSSGRYIEGEAIQITGTGAAPTLWTGALSGFSNSSVSYTMPASSVNSFVYFSCLLDIPSMANFSITAARNIGYQMWGGGGGRGYTGDSGIAGHPDLSGLAPSV